jgi:hypothetical protein
MSFERIDGGKVRGLEINVISHINRGLWFPGTMSCEFAVKPKGDYGIDD